MKRLRAAALLLLPVTLLLAPDARAAAAVDRELSATAGEDLTWEGAAAPGLNAYYFGVIGESAPASLGPVSRGTCSKDLQHYCDSTLLTLSNPLTPEEVESGKAKNRNVTISIGDYGPVPDPATDFDLVVWSVGPDGERLREVARDGDSADTANETVGFTLRTTAQAPSAQYIVDVVYFASAGSGFTGTVDF